MQYKMIFSHRPINCLNNELKEACFAYNSDYWGIFKRHLVDLQLDYQISGHLHIYERFKSQMAVESK